MSHRVGWILLCLPLAAAPLAAQVPGWRVTSDSQASVDTLVVHGGHGSGHLRGRADNDFQNLRQSLRPDSLRGRRLRFSGWVRTNLIEGWAGLWMRVDGPAAMEVLAFDNMGPRRIEGTTPWTRYDVVLDVPPGGSVIVLGVLMVGQGDVWLDDITVEAVGTEVPSTDLVTLAEASASDGHEQVTAEEREAILAARRAAPWRLRNPDFEQRP